ncbi:MAG: phosphatidylinositol alpha-1,6-mannosyltransferase [Candidatus Poriferisodalaceae bacterium]
MRRHLLVTNDFPPKIGGIQNYLWELWRRLPSDEFTVLTTAYEGAEEFDAAQSFRVVRERAKVLLPHPRLASRIRKLAAETGAELVIVDPALPLGHLAPSLELPYGVVLHGAEITVPGRLPVSRQLLGRVVRGADVVISAGGYAAAEAARAAGRALPVTEVPPGVDTERFVPLNNERRQAERERFGLGGDGPLVVCVSRLVPRKGFDHVIRAVALLGDEFPGLRLAISGGGRDRDRLERLAVEESAPVSFLGRVSEEDLPIVFGLGDVFAMPCRNRWAGLEQEGFGIVFLEAAACCVPQLAGLSGGSSEAVDDGVTGLIVDDPSDPAAIADGLRTLLSPGTDRAAMGVASRQRAEQFSYGLLARRLEKALS